MSEEDRPETVPEDIPAGAPSPIEDRQTTTGSLRTLEASGERLRSGLRVVFALLLGVLIMANVAIYSFYQALRSRVDSQDHRIERLGKMVTDMLAANENARKIEKIEQQVTGIGGQVTELTNTIKQQAAAEDAMAEAEEPKKKRRKKR